MIITPCFLGPRLSVEAARLLTTNFRSFDSFPERTSSITLGLTKPLENCELEFLFNYEVFPPTILTADTEWRTDGRKKMRAGDVIVQRVFAPPVGAGLCLEFAVKVRQVFFDSSRAGFSYETLDGHAERGISEFYFASDPEGLRFFIHTFSEPGHWTSRAMASVSVLYQSWCTRQALQYVRKQFALHNLSSIATDAR
jgi:hypothetical protein